MEVIQEQKIIELTLSNDNINRIGNVLNSENVIRFALISCSKTHILCDYAKIQNPTIECKNIFNINKRTTVNNNKFNAVMLIPTGIGAEIGGDSGDGNVAARLLGNCVDTLFTHPNVVNGADINEMTSNTIYIEGSVLNDFILGNIGLQPIRGNKMLMIYDENDKEIENMAINAASAARITLGCDLDVLKLKDCPVYSSFYNNNGIAVGKIEYFEKIVDIIKDIKDDYDSIILHTKINDNTYYNNKLPTAVRYFNDELVINPWGGIEAMITHGISNLLGISIAHSPMLFDMKDPFSVMAYNVVNPLKSPEVMSKTELFCVFKGMYKTPKIVTYSTDFGVYTNRDIHVLITPDRCIGLPILAALEMDIPVIAINDDKNIMKNNLELLPWKNNKFFRAKNYFEAAGIAMAIKNGLSINSLKRPIDSTKCI